ncbi:MAG: valine--tRNA ligase [Chlorobiota bacterium]
MSGERFPTAYTPNQAERRWYAEWLRYDLFRADPNSGRPPYSILMPPPNVTGMLHFGHVLNITLQDIYIRWHRMLGYEVCWFPGLDHAGIATQVKVEQQLAAEGLTRQQLGRERFVERVWQWKERYGGIILEQMRALGISCDWSRTLFTMDESASNAVREVFIRLYDEGLIYRGKRIINWSPRLQSALSDEEVVYRSVTEELLVLRYELEDGSGHIPVATVRPETIFADVAVAIHPEDERYKTYVGRRVRVPLTDRFVPVIEDEAVDPTFGTGALKVTPAHDPLDFEIGQRHGLPLLVCLTPEGVLNELAGPFAGLERFEARRRVTERLRELGLLERSEPYTHNVGFSERSGEPVEPYISDQWFVRMKPLAEPALQAVLDGRIRFHPEHWVKTYEHWMRNVRDWCISRQLWWGHRIPVYYTPDGRYTAARSPEEARQRLGLSPDVPLEQDPDVLDTWFSSWLWPLTTMRWLADGKTEETTDLKVFLPTNLLVTAPEIIFFWVARMIMATLKFRGTIPFRDVYFTSVIRDSYGRKLSKSLGNSPDPLPIIAKYGADAVRFTMIYLAPLGQDVRMKIDERAQDIPSMEIGRNFANKLWNAGRFLWLKCQQYGLSDAALLESELALPERWIRSRFAATLQATESALREYRVHEYARLLYDFVWSDFCDWYIEALKVLLQRSTPQEAACRCRFALDLYEGILRLLHPVTPFVTEELWHLLWERREGEFLCTAAAASAPREWYSAETEEAFSLLQALVEEARRLRAILGLPPQERPPLFIRPADDGTSAIVREHLWLLDALVPCQAQVGTDHSTLDKALSGVVRGIELLLPISADYDLSAELERLHREIARLERLLEENRAKLHNEAFLQRAPQHVIEREREKEQSFLQSLSRLRERLQLLESLTSGGRDA